MQHTSIEYDLTIVTRRMAHHSKYSGYDRLSDYLKGDVIYPAQHWTIPLRTTARILKPMVDKSGCQWYHRDGLISELSAMRRWLTSRKRVFHFLYGENSFRYLGAMKSTGIKNRIVCTYHTPPDRFTQIIKTRNFLRHIDALIVVSTVQQEFFSKMIGDNRVFYIPHGVDIEHYIPAKISHTERGRFECLFVGSHLRDIKLLAEAAKELQHLDPEIHLTIITSQEYSSCFSDLSNVDVKVGVSDAELLDRYQTADIFLLPLLDCTANNGLLEAMSCGLPIISTDLQGVRDYVNKSCAILTKKGNLQELVEAVLTAKGNEKKLKMMGEAGRKYARTFSWEVIAGKVTQLYKNLG